MKQSVIFSEAAKLIGNVETYYCCVAIEIVVRRRYNVSPFEELSSNACNDIEIAIDFLASFYKPLDLNVYDSWFKEYGHSSCQRAHDARIDALMNCAAKAKIIEENV
jgi:hypothetical protein